MSHDIAHGVYYSGLVLEDINMIYVFEIKVSHDIALFPLHRCSGNYIAQKKVNFHRS